jgi:hypothetical protein
VEPGDQRPPDITGRWRLYQLVEEARRQGRTDREFLLLAGTLNAQVRSYAALERPLQWILRRRPLEGSNDAAAPKPPEESG